MTVYVSAHNVAAVNLQARRLLTDALADLASRDKRLATFAVTGSRTWFDWQTMWSVLALIPRDATMFNGLAKGADDLSLAFWRLQRSPYRPFEPNWSANPGGAGMVRNTIMMECMPQLVVAFLCSDGPSRGTRDAIAKAGERGIPTFTFHQYVPPTED